MGKTKPSKKTEQRISARERMAAERQRRAAAEKRRRGLIVGGAVVAVLAIAATVGIVVGNSSGAGTDDVRGRAVTPPPGAAGPGQTVIPDGKADAPAVLTVYEDFRCPFCDRVEKTLGPTIRQLADAGRFRVEYHIASFLDDRLGGNGSRRAANAAACAQQAGKFRDYHEVLFANQPDEDDDAFGKRAHLLDLAGKVDGLRTPAFEACVNDSTFAPWVKAVEDDFVAKDIGGTPTVLLDGRPMTVLDRGGNAVSPDAFRAQVDQALGK
ncbi:MAG: thioredoxin domain-containing protein [Streptomycetaceae bacterium]|jgi:protein-disulfide isomerase|nr:thioredoxin domain-containing protein [Streptomycetaceae bacterium]